MLWAACLPFIMVSCDKPEKGNAENGSTEIAGASGKMLVKKMTAKGTLAYQDNSGNGSWKSEEKETTKVDATLTFTYADGKMSRLSAFGNYANVYDSEDSYNGEVEKYHYECEGSGNGNLAFTYNGDVIKVTVSAQGKIAETETNEPDSDENYSDMEEGSISGDYTLNMSNGAAVSGQGTFKGDDGSYTTDKVKFEYDNNNQLTSLYYDGEYEYRTEFKWENGNMVNVGWYDNDDDYKKAGKKHHARMPFGKKRAKAAKSGSIEWNDYYRVEYSSKENKSNIDFAGIIFTYLGGYYEQTIGVFGFLGKESKNLPSKIYVVDEDWNEETGEYETEDFLYLSLEYEFNGNGTVKKIKLSSPELLNEDYDTATATIELEY